MSGGDPYIDPETGVLRNLAGAKTEEDLEECESNNSVIADLVITEIPRTNDFAELSAIHYSLFSSVYDWVGKIRTVDILRPGSKFFLSVDNINTGLDFIFAELAKEEYLQNLHREKFIERLTYFFEQLNFLHPFREGNGRTQRIFWSRVAKDAGFLIDWTKTSSEEINEASRIAHDEENLESLKAMFEKIVAKSKS